MNQAQPSGTSSGAAGVWRGIDLLKTILGPASVFTVVLYYFGWVRSNAIARFWGYSTTTIGLSNNDYLLGSVVPLFRPLAAASLALLVARLVMGAFRRAVETDGVPQGLLKTVSGVQLGGYLMLGWALFRLDSLNEETSRPVWWFVTAALITIGPALIWLGLWAGGAARWAASRRAAPWSNSSASSARFVSAEVVPLLVVVATLGLFVFTTQFAARSGTARAIELASTLPARAEVTLYSVERLHLNDHGIVESPVGSQGASRPPSGDAEAQEPVLDGEYRWRYSGLRLIAQGANQVVVAPASYSPGSAEVFVLPVGDGLRLDVDRSNYWQSRPSGCSLDANAIECAPED